MHDKNAMTAEYARKLSLKTKNKSACSRLSDVYRRIHERASAGGDSTVVFYFLNSEKPEIRDYIIESTMDYLRATGFDVVFEGLRYGTAKFYISWKDDPTERLYDYEF